MTKSFPPRPTKITPTCTGGCLNGWIRHMGSDYPCSSCENRRDFASLCKSHAVDAGTLLSLPIPEGKLVVFKESTTKFHSGHRVRGGFQFIAPTELLDYMAEGFEMIPHDIYNKRDEGFLESNPHLLIKEEVAPEPKPVAKVEKPKSKKSSKLGFTKEAIHSALGSDDNVNAAIAYLGDMQTADELSDGDTKHQNGKGFTAAYGKTGRHLWIWVTGKDSRNNFEVKWDPKSLAHIRADRTFSKFIRNYDEIETAIDLGRHIAKIHWKQLGFIVDAGYKATVLPVTDKPRPKVEKKNTPPVMFDLTGAKVLRKSGKATQFRWDSRKVWLPNSQLKMVGGKLQVPVWLAKKNGML